MPAASGRNGGNLVVQGGRVVLESGIVAADVIIREGRVSALAAPGSARNEEATRIEADGAFVLPGGVDAHTHVALSFGEVSTLDDFASASYAAAVGGTTSFLEFAIPMDEETPLEALRRRLRQADRVTHVDYGFHGCVARSAGPEALADIARMAQLGVTSIKVFTAYRGLVMLELGEIRDVMRASAAVGSLVLVHAETESLIESSLRELREAGLTHARHQARSRPAEAELDAASSILRLARSTGCPVYLVHVTVPEVADAISSARSEGVDVYGESCPHYLLLDETCYSSDRPELFVCSPPLRPRAAVAELWSQLGRALTGVHSDHCCFDSRQKTRSVDDLERIPPGVPGIETRVPLMISEALHGRIDLTEVVALCATRPARLFGMPRKGSLLPGFDGDLVLVDPDGTNEIADGARMSTDFCPFDGRVLRGRIDTVVSRGRVLVRGGKWADLPAAGSFIERGPHRSFRQAARAVEGIGARNRGSGSIAPVQ